MGFSFTPNLGSGNLLDPGGHFTKSEGGPKEKPIDYLQDVRTASKGGQALENSTKQFAQDLWQRNVNPLQGWGGGAAGKWGGGGPGGNLGYQMGGAGRNALMNQFNMGSRVGNKQIGAQRISDAMGLQRGLWDMNDMYKQANQDIINIKAGREAERQAEKQQMWNSGMQLAGTAAGAFAAGRAAPPPGSGDGSGYFGNSQNLTSPYGYTAGGVPGGNIQGSLNMPSMGGSYAPGAGAGFGDYQFNAPSYLQG